MEPRGQQALGRDDVDAGQPVGSGQHREIRRVQPPGVRCLVGQRHDDPRPGVLRRASGEDRAQPVLVDPVRFSAQPFEARVGGAEKLGLAEQPFGAAVDVGAGRQRRGREPGEIVEALLAPVQLVVELEHLDDQARAQAERRRRPFGARLAGRAPQQHFALGGVEQPGRVAQPRVQPLIQLGAGRPGPAAPGHATGGEHAFSSVRRSSSAAPRVGTITAVRRASTMSAGTRCAMAARRAFRSGTRTRRVERGVITGVFGTRSGAAAPRPRACEARARRRRPRTHPTRS